MLVMMINGRNEVRWEIHATALEDSYDFVRCRINFGREVLPSVTKGNPVRLTSRAPKSVLLLPEWSARLSLRVITLSHSPHDTLMTLLRPNSLQVFPDCPRQPHPLRRNVHHELGLFFQQSVPAPRLFLCP